MASRLSKNPFIVFLTVIRGLIAIPLLTIITGFYSAKVLLTAILTSDRVKQQIPVRHWGKLCCAVLNVEVVLKGEENLSEKGVLFVFNHTSLYDILAAFAAIKKTFRFGAKIELFKVPLFGRAMTRIGILPIMRHNRQEVFKVYEAAKKRFRNGESFFLAPEGTRMKTTEIGPFKSGPFIFAIEAQAPIVPVVIKGAYEIAPKKKILMGVGRWKPVIYIQFLPEVSVDGLSIENREELKAQIREDMIKTYKSLPEV